MTLLLAELLKLRTTRMVYGLFAALLVIVGIFTVVVILASKKQDLTSAGDQSGLFGSAATGIIFVLLLGVMLIAGEFRHGTITQTFLITPARWKVLGAKLVAAAILGFVFGVLAELFAFLLGAPLLEARGIDFTFGREARDLVIGTIIATTLASPLGVAIGSVIRNQVAAIIVVFAVMLIVEPLVSGLIESRWPAIPKFFPGHGITGVVDDDPSVFAREWSALLLVGYVAVLSAIGGRFILSRDVNSIQA